MAILISKTKDNKLVPSFYGDSKSAEVTFGRGALEKVLTKLGKDADDTVYFGKGDSGAVVLDGSLASSKILDVIYTKDAAKITIKYVGKEDSETAYSVKSFDIKLADVLDDLNADITSDNYKTLKVQVVEDHGKLTDVSVNKTDAESTFTDKTDAEAAKFEVKTADGFALGSDLTNLKSYVDAQAAASKTVVEGNGNGDGVTVTSETDAVSGLVTYKVSTDLTLEYHAAAGDKAAYFALEDATNKAELGTINIADIIGNGVLKSTAYDESTGKLTLTFAAADGKDSTVEVDLGKLLDVGDIFVGDDSAKYLTATTNTTTDGTDEKQVKFDVKITDVSTASDTATGLADAYQVKKYVDAKVTDLSSSLDADVSAVGTNVSVGVTEEDGKLTKVTVTEKYATVTSAKTGDADTTVTVTDDTALVTGKDISTLVDFTNTRLSEEVAKLDATVTVEDTNKFVKVVTAEVDGKLDQTGSSVSVVTAKLGDATGLTKGDDGTFSAGSGTVTADGLATVKDVADEMHADEKVVAEALNDLYSNIKDIDSSLKAIDASVDSSSAKETVTKSKSTDEKSTINTDSPLVDDQSVSVDVSTDTYTLYLNGAAKEKTIDVVTKSTIDVLIDKLAEEKLRAMVAEKKLEEKTQKLLTWIEV